MTTNGPFSTGSTTSKFTGLSFSDCGIAGAVGGEPDPQVRADELFERAVEQLLAGAADAGRERVIDVHDPAAAIPDRHQMGDRIERILQLPPRPDHVVEQLHVFDRARQLRPTSSARSSSAKSPPGSKRTPSNRIVPSARRVPRSGTVIVEAAASAAAGWISGGRGAHRGGGQRQRIVGRRARPVHDVAGIGGGAQDQMTGAPIVEPDRGAIGAEQPVGSPTERFEAG